VVSNSDGSFPYFEVIVFFIVTSTLFETYLDIRQHGNFYINKVPKHLKDHLSKEKFDKGQAYGLAKSSFGFVVTTYGLIETLVVLFTGFYPVAWGWSVTVVEYFGYDESYEVLVSFVFVGIFHLLSYLQIPFQLYSIFVIEERFGFNKQTLSIFVMDKLKSLLVGVVLTLPLLAIVIKVMQWGGENFWLWLWGVILAFQLFFLTVYPVFIAPLFNNFTPLEEGELRDKIEALAKKLEFPLTKLFVVDGSTRSAHSNAYFYGFFKNKRVVLFDTLLKQVDSDGIVAILGHEMGHWKMNHNLKNMVIIQAYVGTFLFLFSSMIHSADMYRAFGFTAQPTLVGMMLFSIVFTPVEHLFSLFMHVMSRHFEYQADEFATRLGLELSEPLIKIHVENLSTIYPDPWYSAYHNSHPTILERIAAIEALQKKK